MKKVSIISGGSSGLGLEIAVLLVRAGKHVIILGRNKERIANALTRIGKEQGEGTAEGFSCNIGIEREVRNLGTFMTENDFITEYLFNNAGRGLFTKADTSTSELIDAIFEPNLKGLILLTSEILRITPKEEELSIINIMSTSALLGRAEETIYCAAKWGARGYTEALRTELKGTKRNIFAIYPGGMKTGFWDVTDHSRDVSGYMDPADVAEKIVPAILLKNNLAVTDITINRK